jgi:integrase
MATFRKRGETYQIRVSLGYDLSGQQIIKSKTWKPSPDKTAKQIEKELNAEMVLFEERCRKGLVTDGNMRFADYANQWMAINEDILSPTTYIRYQSLLSRINIAIGHKKLCDIQSHHLQDFYKNLGENGINKRDGKTLSGKTILHHHRLISVILGEAYKQGYIIRDVSELVTPPKVNQKEVAYLDEQDAIKLYDALSNAPIKWKTALLLLLYTGLRRGELCGLEWNDIDFINSTISIRRNVSYIVSPKYEYTDENGVFHKGKIIEKEPKTKSSQRVISVDDGVLSLLMDYKRWWIEQRFFNGNRWIETNKLFIKENGGCMHPDSITDYTAKFYKANNLPQFSPHSLRHSNISLMIANGVDIKTVSARAGHANISTTGNIYTHQIKSANARAAEKIGNIFDGIQQRKKHA